MLFVPELKPVTLLLDKFALLAGILPKPVVTLHAPVSPAPTALACKLIVVAHTVWLSAVIIVASTALFVTVIVPVLVQPFFVADHWNVLGPEPKPDTLGVLVVPFAIAIVPAPAVLIQFQVLLAVMFVPVMS